MFNDLRYAFKQPERLEARNLFAGLADFDADGDLDTFTNQAWYQNVDGKGNFRAVVVPDNHFSREDGWPDDRYLRQGVRANGWVLLRQVPLGYEVWRQLNGFPPTVAKDEPGKEKESKVKLPKA